MGGGNVIQIRRSYGGKHWRTPLDRIFGLVLFSFVRKISYSGFRFVGDGDGDFPSASKRYCLVGGWVEISCDCHRFRRQNLPTTTR